MNKLTRGFVTLPIIIIALLLAGGITAGVVLNKEYQNNEDETVFTNEEGPKSSDTEKESSLEFKCKSDLCVEPGKLNVGIYQTDHRVDVAQYRLTNGTNDPLTINKLVFAHPSSYNFNGLLSLNFALNVDGKQVGSAQGFINRTDHYELVFTEATGQFGPFKIKAHETVELNLQNSVSPFSTGGNVEIFLSEIEAGGNIKFSGNVSGGKIPVADVIGKTECQTRFGTMKNPSTGKIQPIRVRLLSPNGGKYNQGDEITITWETCDLPEYGQLFRAYIGGRLVVSEGPEAVNDGVQIVKIPNDLPNGNHHISIEVLDMYHGGGDYITFDDSDSPLTIGNAQPFTPPEEDEEEVPLIGSAQAEAIAKGKLSSFRAEAEIRFDQNNGSYDGVCDVGAPSHNLFMEARQLVGTIQDNDCKDNSTKYRVWVEMVSLNQIFCVDNTGHAGLISKSSLSNSTYACI